MMASWERLVGSWVAVAWIAAAAAEAHRRLWQWCDGDSAGAGAGVGPAGNAPCVRGGDGGADEAKVLRETWTWRRATLRSAHAFTLIVGVITNRQPRDTCTVHV